MLPVLRVILLLSAAGSSKTTGPAESKGILAEHAKRIETLTLTLTLALALALVPVLRAAACLLSVVCAGRTGRTAWAIIILVCPFFAGLPAALLARLIPAGCIRRLAAAHLGTHFIASIHLCSTSMD